MFRVLFKPAPEFAYISVIVYNVRDDGNGFPQFLVYIDEQWRYISAKYFKPMEE